MHAQKSTVSSATRNSALKQTKRRCTSGSSRPSVAATMSTARSAKAHSARQKWYCLSLRAPSAAADASGTPSVAATACSWSAIRCVRVTWRSTAGESVVFIGESTSTRASAAATARGSCVEVSAPIAHWRSAGKESIRVISEQPISSESHCCRQRRQDVAHSKCCGVPPLPKASSAATSSCRTRGSRARSSERPSIIEEPSADPTRFSAGADGIATAGAGACAALRSRSSCGSAISSSTATAAPLPVGSLASSSASLAKDSSAFERTAAAASTRHSRFDPAESRIHPGGAEAVMLPTSSLTTPYICPLASSGSPCHSERTFMKRRLAPKYCTCSSASASSAREASHAAGEAANCISHALASERAFSVEVGL
mmetsp:Transcript_52654/g.136340  ORF Transcript_52654/g.136340 Transcript_52654/m.136340 type:complete len:371 (-) Transcript_52654:84-1196(-)